MFNSEPVWATTVSMLSRTTAQEPLLCSHVNDEISSGREDSAIKGMPAFGDGNAAVSGFQSQFALCPGACQYKQHPAAYCCSRYALQGSVLRSAWMSFALSSRSGSPYHLAVPPL